MTMKDQVADLLRAGWTSPIQALHQAGCLSLSQRCGELANEGHKVEKNWLDLPNGKRVRIYRIATQENALQLLADDAQAMGLDY